MPASDDDFHYLTRIFHELNATETELNSIYFDIQNGFTKCWFPVSQKEVAPAESKDPVPSALIEEVEKALSKARLIYNNPSDTQSGLEKTKLKPQLSKSKIAESYRDENVKLTKTTTTENKKIVYTKSKSPIRSSSAKFLPAHLTAPFQTYGQQIKTSRHSSDTLIKRSARPLNKNSILQNFKDFPGRKMDILDENYSNMEKYSDPLIGSLSSASSTQHQLVDSKKNELSEQKITFKLDPNVEKRVKEWIDFDVSLNNCCVAYANLAPNSSRRKFAEYINRLTKTKINTKFLRQFFSQNLPEIIFLLKEFIKINSSIDWLIATGAQNTWKRQLMFCFNGLFNSIDNLIPILSPDDQLIREDTRSCESTELKEDVVPDIETLWKAYLCSGELVDPDSSKLLSRSELLSFGPAIFPSAAVSDLEKMVTIWHDICHFQRRLSILSHFENRLPDWLATINQLESQKASTFRLLYGLVLGSSPVALSKEAKT